MDDKTFYTTILDIRRPWFVERVDVQKKKGRVDIFVNHEPGIQAKCPECGQFYSVYDHGAERIYRHLDTCQLATYIHVRLPRVDCPTHGVRQIVSEFGENGTEMTYQFERRVIDVAKECDIAAVTRLCRISWDQGWGALARAVTRGRARKRKKVPRILGIDEKAVCKGHIYQTLIYDIPRGTVEDIVDNREQESLEAYYKRFTPQSLRGIKAVAMDMWDPYIAATRAYVPDAEKKIVFDRFHVMKYVVNAVDEVRKAEHKALQEQGNDILKHTKYLWLYSQENVPFSREIEFSVLRKLDLKVCRAWALKENIRHFWNYTYEKCMHRFFDSWYWWATHSRLEPMIQAARTLKNHLPNILTYAKHHITNALGESLNAKIEKVKRMACGFRNKQHFKTAIFFHCGGLALYPVATSTPSIRFRLC
jgi:transposase